MKGQQMFALCDQGKEEKRLMIGQNPKAEVAPSSLSRNRGKKKISFEERCRREQMGAKEPVSCQDFKERLKKRKKRKKDIYSHVLSTDNIADTLNMCVRMCIKKIVIF